jgi:hypothetical protein
MAQTQDTHEIFAKILADANIKYVNGLDGEAYVLYDDDKGVLFEIIFNKHIKKYFFKPTKVLLDKYKQYGMSENNNLTPQIIFETVAFKYKIYRIVANTGNDVSKLYQQTMVDSDVIFQMRGDFETYMTMHSGVSGYAIGFNSKTKQYGFKRYELIDTLYKICEIPYDKKPNYPDLYKKTKDLYQAQQVVEIMQHLYD